MRCFFNDFIAAESFSRQCDCGQVIDTALQDPQPEGEAFSVADVGFFAQDCWTCRRQRGSASMLSQRGLSRRGIAREVRSRGRPADRADIRKAVIREAVAGRHS